MPTSDPILSQLLEEMRPLLPQMQGSNGPERGRAVSAFLSRFFHVACALHHQPALRHEDEVRLFLRESQVPLARAALDVESYARHLAEMNEEPWEVATDIGPFSVDRWSRSCTERSALEFLIEHFPDAFRREHHAALFELLDEADEHLRRKVDSGQAEPEPDEVPAGVPASHWWWSYRGGALEHPTTT